MGSTFNVTAQKAPTFNISSRLENALANAKSVAERQKPAIPEDALNETYRRMRSDPDALPTNTNLKLAVDEGTGEVIGRIVERSTGEVVAQIPSEETLRLIARTKELFGAIVNETV